MIVLTVSAIIGVGGRVRSTYADSVRTEIVSVSWTDTHTHTERERAFETKAVEAYIRHVVIHSSTCCQDSRNCHSDHGRRCLLVLGGENFNGGGVVFRC